VSVPVSVEGERLVRWVRLGGNADETWSGWKEDLRELGISGLAAPPTNRVHLINRFPATDTDNRH
jgi:hypothetical protein